MEQKAQHQEHKETQKRAKQMLLSLSVMMIGLLDERPLFDCRLMF